MRNTAHTAEHTGTPLHLSRPRTAISIQSVHWDKIRRPGYITVTATRTALATCRAALVYSCPSRPTGQGIVGRPQEMHPVRGSRSYPEPS